MDTLHERSIVRVYNKDTVVVGIGFLVKRNLVLTCSHTVNAALGRATHATEVPHDVIDVDFPFLNKRGLIPAQVTKWYPKYDTGGDVAVLELKHTPPLGAQPVRMKKTEDYEGHHFTAYGCPAGFQEDGRWVEGKLQKFLPNGRVQAIGINDLGYFIECGFSGGPVWDSNLNGVVGMVMSVDNAGGKLQASILPNNAILALYSELQIEGRIYISYSAADGLDITRRLQIALQKEQFEVSIGVSFPFGDTGPYVDRDYNKLESSSAIIVVLTPGAVDSKRVEGELSYAINHEMPVIPVVAASCTLPQIFAMLDPIDFREQVNFEEQLEFLISRLRDLDTIGEVQVHHHLIGASSRRSARYPIVVGQRLTTTIDYFQDREEQLQQIAKLLASPGTRIISVIGSGGMGKTALVSRLLYDLECNVWPGVTEGTRVDGILYLSHRTVGITLERLFLDCAEMLGGDKKLELQAVWTDQKVKTVDRISRLLELIDGGLYIILLDNIEDLLDEKGNLIDPELDAFIQMSLAMPGAAKLLVTSREPIRFGSKDAPLDKQVLLDQGLDTEYGVAMLRQADPSGLYGLRDADMSRLASIVEALHGVPRALEVFVGIVKDESSSLMTPDEVLEQFYRHPMTEKELIEEGYRRLDPNARMILQGLSVYSRPVPITAITYLLAPYISETVTMSVVLRLISIHMINVVDRTKKLIALHPIDRDFAYSQIES